MALAIFLNSRSRKRGKGLSSISEVSRKAARQAADERRQLVRQNKDPARERHRHRREAARSLHLLSGLARDAFESRKAELRGDGLAGHSFSPFDLDALPKLGRMAAGKLTQTDNRDTLASLWHIKTETGRKALDRLPICLGHAAALGPKVDLQTCDRAKALLGISWHETRNVPATA